uniref:Ribosome biogenesis protein BRX1 homolog n=1 Tax=Plectus sambesii TaxID=2011161 RepID=A0A914UWP3_9BILA
MKAKMLKKWKKAKKPKVGKNKQETPVIDHEEDDEEDVEEAGDATNGPVAGETANATNGADAETKKEGPIKKKWTNRERVLVFCSRGAAFRDRHLMNDFKALMPHAKGESKLDNNTKLPMINEIAEMKNCTKCLYFENRKRKDLYMWAANIGKGPSVKFLVHNVHTMDELRLSGNCLKGSRPVLSFDQAFDSEPHLQLIKQLFMQTFGTPNYHPRSQPFVDHVFSFSLTGDGRIWFRNFQIVDEQGMLQEIGPRMVLEVIKVFDGAFEGAVLYENPSYQSPNDLRRQLKLAGANRYTSKQEAKQSLQERTELNPDAFKGDPLDELFDTTAPIDDQEGRKLKRAIEQTRTKRKDKKKPKIE